MTKTTRNIHTYNAFRIGANGQLASGESDKVEKVEKPIFLVFNVNIHYEGENHVFS